MVGSAQSSPRRLRRLHVATGFATLLLFGVAYAALPSIRPQMLEEGRFLETLTAWTFLAGAVLGVAALLVHRDAPGVCWIVPACSLIGALDEISFGARVFDLTLPQVRGIEIDGIHDIVMVVYDILETQNPLYLSVYVLAPVMLLGALVWLYRRSAGLRSTAARTYRFLRRNPPLQYVVTAAMLVAVALVLDLDLVDVPWLVFLEELLELNAALALVFGAAAIAAGDAVRADA